MRTRICAQSAGLLLCFAIAFGCACNRLSAAGIGNSPQPASRHFVTTAAQFRDLSGADYLDGCDFRLTGAVTLVDTNRDLMVVQDDTGAVALHFNLPVPVPQVGQLVTLEGTNGYPYFPRFPNYPFHPSGSEILPAFESPIDRGEYQLTRMRGYVSPPETGDYTFWIASDNSSELWLSTGVDPSKARKIASIPRFDWVSPRDWSRYPSQKSEPVALKAGQKYYIEALVEQNVGGDHVAVAWQGPGLAQCIVAAPHLTPWDATRERTHGILWEHWTNYSAGDLVGLTGPRPFASALTVRQVQVNQLGPGTLPDPHPIALNHPLQSEDNFRRVSVEGLVTFVGGQGDIAVLELTDGQAALQVRTSPWNPELCDQLRGSLVRVEGVCEGVYDQTETRFPGLIWATEQGGISVVEEAITNAAALTSDLVAPSIAAANPAMPGFYGTRGVVTFNDRVFGTHYIFIQQGNTAIRIIPRSQAVNDQLQVGRRVDVGGTLESGRRVSVLTPLTAKDLGWHAMPPPITESLNLPASANHEGRWCEQAGVVHAVKTNGLLSLAVKDGLVWLWIGHTSPNELTRYVDAKVRVRGVLMSSLLDAPALLVPSGDFIELEEPPPKDPFDVPQRQIADLVAGSLKSAWPHRVRVMGA
ncbi:MAG TPA: PA14 domain-containing protein, partial [Verrucomicrobiota bacterium]|nr:PA14 domain-containing protein [Verrucomicrobiota bacterium]